jgi:hypothetical protein
MASFHQVSGLAATRNEGLHPKLRDLLERAATAPLSEVSTRPDGLIQAGPSPYSEVVFLQGNVMSFSLEPTRAVLAASKPEPQRNRRRQVRGETASLSYAGCLVEAGLTDKSCASAQSSSSA